MGKQDNLRRGVLLGAGAMYFLDPEKGHRRRTLIRDQLVHLMHQMDDAAGTAARDLGNRTRGVAAEARSRLRSGSADDTVVEARVRSELGRLVSHPGAIHVMVQDGRATLSGPVLAGEVDALLKGVAGVRGVKDVENMLQVHRTPGDIPGLQGEGRRRAPRAALMQENWAPATRLLVGALGGVMALSGKAGKGPLGTLAGLAGLGMLARAATNMDTGRLLGVGSGRRGVDLHKTVNVDAPVEEVFALWSNYENFPRFMSHLREVRMTDEERSHWTAELPGGATLGWDAETTAFVQNEVIAWRSIGSSPVQNAGIVRFQPNPQGGTRVDIHLTYNPPAGALGHAVASLLGADAKRMMDDDLVRFQSLLELGKTTAHGNRVTREEVLQEAGGASTMET